MTTITLRSFISDFDAYHLFVAPCILRSPSETNQWRILLYVWEDIGIFRVGELVAVGLLSNGQTILPIELATYLLLVWLVTSGDVFQ